MIQLKLKKPHRSILEFPETSLPDFVVVTGVNGAGKTHLLEAIENGSIEVNGLKADRNLVKRYDWTSLVPTFDKTADPLQHRQQLEEATNQAVEHLARHRGGITKWFTQHGIIGGDRLSDVEWLLSVSFEEIKSELLQCARPNRPPIDEGRATRYANSFVEHREQQTKGFLNSIESFGAMSEALTKKHVESGQHPLGLTEEGLAAEMPLFLNPGQSLQFRLAEWFAAYHHSWEFNRYYRYRVTQEGDKTVTYLRDEDFISRYGPKPWEIINEIFAKAGLPYVLNHPSGPSESKFELRLVDPSRSELSIAIEDLSFGERIILSIALMLYQTTSGTRLARIPKLLLLDEVDAPLHPSFTRILLDTLKTTLVDQHGLQIVLTTHSPSTVALAPDDSLYELQRQPRILKSVTRAHAVQILTSGFITVMPTSRIVVVESSFDSITHAKLHESIVEVGAISATPPLSFVPASKVGDDGSNGGSAQVENWAPKLDSVLKEIGFRGLIDRDDGRIAVGVVKVLNRYSIENYLLDPLTIAALLIKDGVIGGFTNCPISDMNVHKLTSLGVEALQRLVDDVVGWLETDHAILTAQCPNRFDVKYLFGSEISMPCWVRDFRGHDLETLCKQTLNPMCDKIKRPIILPARDSLARVLEMQTKCLPSIIPTDLRDIYGALKS